MVNITQDDLLRYMYDELSPEKRLQIQQLSATDTELRDRMQVLISEKQKLDTIELMSPDMRTLENIFAYAEREAEVISSGE